MKTDPSKNIPSSVSSPEEWIIWHKNLKRWFSRKEANGHFVRLWNQRAGAGSEADQHSIRDYMKSQGVELATDWGGAFSDSAIGVADWIGTGLNWTRAIIIGSTILGGVMISYYFYVQIKKGKTAKDAAVMIANARTGGALKAVTASKTKLITA